MPKYAPDLTDYLTKLGEGQPTEALEGPELLRRSLSSEAPITLVGRVAQALENVDEHPVIADLSGYEHGRVLRALGRKEEAVEAYRAALETCTDRETRWCIMMNLANDVDSDEERETLLGTAILEGSTEALAHMGLLLDQSGETETAEEFLLEAIRKGVGLALPLLGQIYMRTKKGDHLRSALEELMELAQSAGIEDAGDAPFDQLDNQTLVRTPDGVLHNLLAKTRPMREMVARSLGLAG